MARNKKVEILSHDGQVLHPITDGDCVIFPDGETLTHKLSEQEEVMYTPEVVNSSPMFKVGEGDTSDYSSSVLDGAYQEAILKGQTYVNTIQEPSADVITLPTPFTEYERTQSKTFTEMQDGTFGLNLVGQSYVNCIQEPSEPSYVALGENLEFQNKKVEYTTDGQIKSATLNGQTLVNLLNKLTVNADAGQTKNWYAGSYTMGTVKSGKYILFYNVKQTSETTRNTPRIRLADDTYLYHGYDNFNTTTGIKKWIFTANADLLEFSYWITNNTGKVVIDDFILLEYQDGMENWDIPYFQGMQSVTMSTELENVCGRYNSSVAKNGKTFTVGTLADRSLSLSSSSYIMNYGFKQNTKYLIQFKISNLVLDGLNSIRLYFYGDALASGNCLFGENAIVDINKNGIYRAVLTTTNVINTSQFVIKGTNSQWENTTSTTRTLTISQIMCIEYQNGMENWDLPYFETTQLMKPLKVRSVNKNLFDTANMFNSYKTTVSEVTTNSFRLTGTDSNATYKNTPFIFNVKPNTDYKITFKSETTDADALCDVYDANNKYLGNRNFNSGNNTRVSVRFYVNMNNTKNGTVKYYDIQMEESLTETPYVPHQEKTISALEPITLRAIGNVKDTLDLSTGEYIQRIGEITFDGSNDEIWYPSGLNQDLINASRKNLVFYYNHENNGTLANLKLSPYSEISNIISDKLARISHEEQVATNVIYDFPSIAGGNRVPELRIAIPVENSTAQQDSATCKAWLKENPIKVQYELANPITRKISLEYPNLQTYTDITHVQSIDMDGTLIPNIYLPSDISYKAMLKPNTSYNVIVDREVIDSTNQLTVNLGGTTANITANRTVVRTPSTLSNETLTFSGKDNRIAKAMLIEGSTLINGDLPHFDGIGDVKLGRVVENLCLSNEKYVGDGSASGTYYENKVELKMVTRGSFVACFPLTKQLINGRKYFIYCPMSCSVSSAPLNIAFTRLYNGVTGYGLQPVVGNGKKSFIITMDEKSQLNPYTQITVGCHSPLDVNTTMTIRRPILCEYIDGMENWDWESIGYFTGTRNIGNEFMRIGNKNLFDGQIIQGAWNSDTDFVNSKNYVCTKNRILVKPNTTYTTSLNGIRIALTKLYIDEYFNLIKMEGNGTSTFTTPTNCKYLKLDYYKSEGVIPTDLQNLQVEEATSATSYTAHKHNSLHISPNEQIPLTFVQGVIIYGQNSTWESAINNTNANRIRTQLLDLEPNETYRISCGSTNHSFAILGYNTNLLGKFDSGWTYDEYYFTTTKDVHKYAINVRYKDNSNITPSALHQVRLEKVTDVTLRSVGDVKDELDLTRGVYIQRIGEIVVDGSQITGYTTNNTQDSSTMTRCYIRLYDGWNPTIPKNKFNVAPRSNQFIGRGWITNNPVQSVIIGGSYDIHFIVYTKDLPEYSLSGCKAYFKNLYDSGNPAIVQYVLETPIEHKIHIPMKNESNQTIAKPNGIFTLPLMHSETNHIDINSQIYPKVQSRDYISYPVIASPSQQYTVFHNKVVSTDLTVNLCGASTTVNTHKNTVTTPSSISQYELRLSGANNKVSNVCVFNGDYMNVNVPYVQGMMNAVNPIVKNVGKNLFNKNNVIQNYYVNSNGGLSQEVGTERNATNYIQIKPNTSYIIDGAKNSGITNNNKQLYIVYYDSNKNYISKYIPFVENTIRLKTPSNAYYLRTTVKNKDLDNFILIEESSTPSQYEPYKENICEPDYGQIKLTKDMFEQGSFNEALINKSYESIKLSSDHGLHNKRIRSNKPIPVKPNTKYIFEIENGSDYDVFVGYCKDDMFISYIGYTKNQEFITPNNCNQIVFVIRKGTASNSVSFLLEEVNFDLFSFRKLDEIITLRSLPNGVRDELNLQTGEYMQRIGEIVFDGSSDENWNTYEDAGSWDNSSVLGLKIKIPNDASLLKKDSNNKFNMICNRYQFCWSKSDIGNLKEGISVYNSDRVYFISIYRKIVDSIQDFKKYIQANPIIIQYELATPIVKQIDIHNFPHSYKDGHVIIESNDPSTNVTAQMTYRCVTNRSGQIQEHTEQVEKQERQINELETLILENIRQQQNRSQNFLTSLISTLEIEEE